MVQRTISILIFYCEVNCRTLPYFALGAHRPAMAVDDTAHQGEPDAGSLELLGAVEPLERPEKAFRVFHVETGAIVADEKLARTIAI